MADFLILAIGKYLVFVFLLPLVYFWLKGKKSVVFQALLAVLIANILSLLVGIVFPALRPFELAETSPRVPIFFLEQNSRFRTTSFPSKHAAASAAIAFSVLVDNKLLGLVLLAFALSVGAGRVWAFVHRWFDVVGGFGLGLFAAFVARFVVNHKVIGSFMAKMEAKLPPYPTHE
ncbi:MAG: phosphatase PAP2 family protein [Patescibacteria group bacterium]|nr:phosphatase PAP2 family protein [Patescibacteria group bacterium]